MGFKCCGDKQIIPPIYYNSSLLLCKSKFFPWINQEKLRFLMHDTIIYSSRRGQVSIYIFLIAKNLHDSKNSRIFAA